MPSTYNGIGTHYYGKKNVTERPGPCPHCGAAVTLTSYDTRLWFVVVFIPVIPLGRKRIIDQCPSCTRHFAAAADKWENARRAAIAEATEKFRSTPTAESGIELHERLLQFHDYAQAAEFRRALAERFPTQADVQAYLGNAFVHLGQPAEAAAYFARALQLRPDLPEARIGMALEYIRTGRLDEARPLLNFLEKSGASQSYSLGPLETLGLAYQRANRHEDALTVFALLQAELPHIADIKAFRSYVRTSEKALGIKQTSLPKKKFSWRGLFTRGTPGAAETTRGALLKFSIVGVCVAAGFAISNEYIRQHRTVYLVNDTGQPVSVQIDDSPATDQFQGVREVTLTEGQHRATVSGARQTEIPFVVGGDYFGRWFDDPVWVLNVDAAAILIRNAVVYAENPPPATSSIHFGAPFEYFSDVTHPFRALPPTLQMKRGEHRTLTELELYRGEGENLLQYLEQSDRNEALRFAETWLRTHPDDAAVLRRYAHIAQNHARARAEAFLSQGLAARPVPIEWHRMYQGLMENSPTANNAALIARYDEFLQAAPSDSALLYLRGRIEPQRARARDFFERARHADPRNAYAHYALGYDRSANGDWAEAKVFYAEAAKLRPDDEGFSQVLFLARVAAGESSVLEKEQREAVTRDPADVVATLRLIEVLGAQQRGAEAIAAADNYARAATTKFGATEARDVVATVKYHALYAAGDFPALERAGQADPSRAGRQALATALIEQGRPAEAAKLIPALEELAPDFLLRLTLAVSFRQAGDENSADHWIERAGETLVSSDPDKQFAANLLANRQPPTPAAARELNLQPQEKAVLLTVLAQRHPSVRAQLADFARRLNHAEHSFPFHLVERVTGRLTQSNMAFLDHSRSASLVLSASKNSTTR